MAKADTVEKVEQVEQVELTDEEKRAAIAAEYARRAIAEVGNAATPAEKLDAARAAAKELVKSARTSIKADQNQAREQAVEAVVKPAVLALFVELERTTGLALRRFYGSVTNPAQGDGKFNVKVSMVRPQKNEVTPWAEQLAELQGDEADSEGEDSQVESESGE